MIFISFVIFPLFLGKVLLYTLEMEGCSLGFDSDIAASLYSHLKSREKAE